MDLDISAVEAFLEPFLPRAQEQLFVTATWAQSLDARIAAAPGVRTRLSGAYTKQMTHFMRSRHDAILVGRRTVLADDPRLNCRLRGARSPRPVILDAGFVVPLDCAVMRGDLKPWVVAERADDAKVRALRAAGGDVLFVPSTQDWAAVYSALHVRGVHSLMVEGGAEVLHSCLAAGVDAVVITVAPTFLGPDGVAVAPQARELTDVQWFTLAGVPDSVVAGRLSDTV